VSTPGNREVIIAPQERGWAVITRYHGGKWDGFQSVYYCRWIWQANREYNRQMRRVVQ
jgi:hypothetical protein